MRQRVHLHGSAGHFQRPLPVGQFERRVDGGLGRERFLCRNTAAQGIGGGSLTGGLAGKVEHELGGLFNQRTETPDVRTRATQQFGEIDEMRLLPNKVAACFRRGFLSAGVGHLHPTDTLVALSLGNLAGHGLGLEIPVERPLKQFGMSPKRELCLMPPNHLQVIFAEPRIIGQAGFLRRRVAGAVHGQQILREHHPPFQFLGPRVAAAAEVHDATRLPVLLPVICGGGEDIGGSCSCQRRPFAVFAGEGEVATLGREHKAVGAFCLKARLSRPADVHPVSSGIERSLQQHLVSFVACNSGGVLVVGIPVAGIVGVHSGGVGKAEKDGQLFLPAHLHSHHVAFGMDCRPHLIFLTFIAEPAVQ